MSVSDLKRESNVYTHKESVFFDVISSGSFIETRKLNFGTQDKKTNLRATKAIIRTRKQIKIVMMCLQMKTSQTNYLL